MGPRVSELRLINPRNKGTTQESGEPSGGHEVQGRESEAEGLGIELKVGGVKSAAAISIIVAPWFFCVNTPWLWALLAASSTSPGSKAVMARHRQGKLG